MTENIYSVGKVNEYIKDMFEQDFLLSRIAVSGEVSNCKYHSSGHVFFTLKDHTGVLQTVMFAGMRRSGLKFPLQVGDKVIVRGEIRVYERDGKYQLYAREVTLQGEGALYQKYEELKRCLEEMGMFAVEYKLPIPKYASRVGIVTASTGAAVRDIQNIARRRNPAVQLILCPAQVQGEGAAASVASGIRTLTEQDVDVIIVGRGGGSIEDLWAFNEETVARAIFDCPIPVVSAVGHETDTTIADHVADLRAPTPSAAAELVVFDLRQTYDLINEGKLALSRALAEKLEQERTRAHQYRLRLEVSSPKSRLLERRQTMADCEDRLRHGMERILSEARHRLQLSANRLDAASPLKKLEGGYAYVQDSEGKHPQCVSDLTAGDQIRAYMLDGSFTATVDGTCKESVFGGVGSSARSIQDRNGEEPWKAKCRI